MKMTVPIKKVLTEDKYVQEIEKIIQRDFFSDITKLKAQTAYLEAVETNDVSKLRELYEKYSIMRTPQRPCVPLNASELMENMKNRHQICHQKTRFDRNPFNERLNQATISEAAHNQARSLEGKVGIDGKELVIGQTPSTNQWSLLRTPSPNPDTTASPFMTWGEIEGTPFRLDASDVSVPATPRPSFKIPELSKRDQMALKLADKVSQQHRENKDRALEASKSVMGSPATMHGSKSVLKRLGFMSPAAQQLATSRLGVRLGSEFRTYESPTPSPKMLRLATANQSPAALVIKRPNTLQKTPKIMNDSLTDNLLQLPKRQRAADYF